MLNMYLSQIICLNKQHVSSNVHVVNFVGCHITWSQPPAVNTFSPHLNFSSSNLSQSNTGSAVSSMCKKGSSDHVDNMTERASAWHTLKRVLRYHSQKWKHRACTDSHIHKIRNSVFLLCIIHITHKLILASRSFVFKAYENKAPNSVPKFMTEFTEQVNIRPDQEPRYKSGLHFDIYKGSFQRNISFRLYTLLKTKILFYFFIYYYFHPSTTIYVP